MKTLILFTLFITAAAVGRMYGQSNAAYIPSVIYGTAGQKSLRLDIYHPDTTRNLPVVVFIHGGGWSAGDKSIAASFAPSLVSRGIVCVGVQYRLSGEAKWPAQINDCKGAVRFLKANAAKYHLDTTRFGAWGSSAGGHLAAVLGTSTDLWGTREFSVGAASMDIEGSIGGNLSVTSKVHAVCNWFGPTDFLRMNDEPTSIDHLSPTSPESQLLGCPVLECKDKAELANPIHYITPDDAFFLTMHGDKDNVVPLVASVIFDSALRANHISSIFRVIHGEGHGFTSGWLDTAAEFFRWRFYGDVQSVRSSQPTITLYPNPTDGEITIVGISNPEIRLYDVVGREYPASMSNTGYETIVQLPKRSGMYYCVITGNGYRRVIPVVRH